MHGQQHIKICRMLFQKNIILRYCASGWFYNRNILRSTVLQTSNSSLLYGSTAVEGLGFLVFEVSLSLSDTTRSVRLPWTSDRPVAETSTWQQTKIEIHKYPCPGGIRTRNPSRWSGADLPGSPDYVLPSNKILCSSLKCVSFSQTRLVCWYCELCNSL